MSYEQQLSRAIRFLIAMCLMVIAFSTMALCSTSYAATKTISSVAIKAEHSLEAGDKVKELKIDTTGAGAGDINISVSDDKYTLTKATIKEVSSTVLEPGAALTISAVLNVKDTSAYSFSGTYTKSNVKITTGTFVEATKKTGQLTVTFTLKPVSGTYEAPYEPEWNISSTLLGRAIWDAPDTTSGYYDIWLYRGNSLVTKVTDYKGSSYNFYSYMNTPGTYYYKVRTVPHTSEEKKYCKTSDWAESSEYYIDSDSINKNGISASGTNYAGSRGWVKDSGDWFYIFPNGTMKRNGWEFINGMWYYFNGSGVMQTGWLNSNGQRYYLNNNGQMVRGWHQIDNVWYYFNPDLSSNICGAMLSNAWIRSADGAEIYYLTSSGRMAEGWCEINGDWYYFYQGLGKMARNTIVDTFKIGADGKWIP